MNKYFFLILLFSTISCSVMAQDFGKSYVIDLEGDTLTGNIYLPDNQQNYLRINFFEWGDFENVIQYQPGAIREYGIKNEQVFRSFELPEGMALEEKEAVFLKVLIDRPTLFSLFVFRDSENVETYFIRTGEGKLIGLDASNYRNQLRDISKSCEDLQMNTLVDKTKYRTVDFVRFVNEYNSCVSDNYIIDDSYLSDGVRSFSIRIGTGFGFIANSKYQVDSPDLLIKTNYEYSLSSTNSLMFELGYSKRTMTYEYIQQGRVRTLSPMNSLNGDVKTTTFLDLDIVTAGLFLRRKISNFYLILGGQIGVKLKSSSSNYSALILDQSFKNEFDQSLLVKNDFRLISIIPSADIGIGKAFKINNFNTYGEITFTYMRVRADNENWGPSEVEEQIELQSFEEPYARYTVGKPKKPPTLLMNISLRIPLSDKF